MKLTLKCLIDFRSWLSENYDMKLHTLNDLPEFIQNAYICAFLLGDDESSINYLIKMENENYNEKYNK